LIIVAEGGKIGSMAQRRSAEEVGQVVQQYRASGLSQREFAQQTGIKVSTLGRYVRREGRTEDPQQLVRVRLEAPAEPDSGFVLMLGNGRKIASGWAFSDTALARLIRVAENA
jgi:transcriptional regulator with XRE-family HTH domain